MVFAATRHLKHEWRLVSRQQVGAFLQEFNGWLEGGWLGEALPALPLIMVEAGDGAPPHPLRMWSGMQSDTTLMGITPMVFLKANPSVQFQAASASDATCVRQGIDLLRELFPALTPSLLRHIGVIALIRSQPPLQSASGQEGDPPPSDHLISCSSDTAPGIVFVHPSVLESPWYMAETLLHEGLHSKLYDVMWTHNLLRPNYTREESAQIHPLWHLESERWDVQRSLFGMHVYAHLALFFLRLEHRHAELASRFGPLHVLDPRVAMRRSLDRAHLLGLRLAAVGTQDLGPAGQLLLSRLQEMLLQLDAPPREAELSQRIMADLYERQTLALERRIHYWRQHAPGELSHRMSSLLASLQEVDSELLGKATPRQPLTLDSHRSEDPSRSFPGLRNQVLQTLSGGERVWDMPTLIRSTTRAGRIIHQSHITVELNP
ncbi:aKG-HExxH-type peptide beta-hydroxylase [Corallococcus llansteffanensis]|uniref:HEXXH motif domain-containing protein n=1 Tax=Corallococcus llansteffanensis TaxID=2316731 RepID=A0A3A8PG85_9BACT|nr:HEXXH motif-containing putative peptide modification protein [Corallococcus llansteffanensis]RKH54330.1 hypothetical protein D7V93_25765 [Corallococcus llansteffanensis]